MAEVERKQSVQDILKDMRGLDGLKRLFWQELNYERENKPLSTRQWPESAKSALAEDPVLFASGGEDKAFHVVYCRLAPAELKRGCQRPIVDYLLRDHPYALFVFSNKAQTAWHFLNVKYDEQAEKRRLVRRIAVLPGDGLRTAAERLALLVRSDKSDTSDSPLAIQQRHDEAFDVEKVTKDFYRDIANWYFWALKHSSFPEGARKEDDGLDHISVIRLITRLIFCWFIREKGLIPDTLFERRRLAEWLDGFAPDTLADSASVFYRAILQNLFFATLNTEMDKRDWRREGQNYPRHGGRFTGDPGYFKHVQGAARLMLEQAGTTPKDYDYAVFHQPNAKFPQRVAKMLGFTDAQIRPGLVVPRLGNTYSGASMIGLAATLDVAKPGERIFVTSFGSGAGSDAFDITVTDAIESGEFNRAAAPSVEKLLANPTYLDYALYAKHKGKIVMQR